MSSLSRITSSLADSLCGGSSRKLIAGWWYTILLLCFALILMSFWTLSTRTGAEAFCSFWSASLIAILCIGGTMVMRKFHNRSATGVFLGALVGAAQFFFLLFLVYSGYASDRMVYNGNGNGNGNGGGNGYGGGGSSNADEDWLQAIICLVQSILLASFALILGVHRSAIMDKHSTLHKEGDAGDMGGGGVGVGRSEVGVKQSSYQPPSSTLA